MGKDSSRTKAVSFADQSLDFLDSGADLSSTQAQYRHLKAMEDIKKKGQNRLNHFNHKLESVREAERAAAKAKTAQKEKAKDQVKDLDVQLDQHISQALNGMQVALTTIYDKNGRKKN